MSEDLGGVRPASIRPATNPTVTQSYDIDRYRLRESRRASRELDELLVVGRTDHTTPNWNDFALGIEERRARGLRLAA